MECAVSQAKTVSVHPNYRTTLKGTFPLHVCFCLQSNWPVEVTLKWRELEKGPLLSRCSVHGLSLYFRFNLFPWRRRQVVCSKSSNNSRTSTEISSAAKIRSEVISPFRSVRMFFYLAFIASGTIGGLISLPRLVSALRSSPSLDPATEVLKGLGIDVSAILIFAVLYRTESKARDQQLAKLSREETLSTLKLDLGNQKIVTVGKMRGIVRLVIVAGPASYIEEAYKSGVPFISDLVERGVLVVPYCTDGTVPRLQHFTSDLDIQGGQASQYSNSEKTSQAWKLWRAVPIYTSEWARWLREQKQLASVPDDKPVYLSLRMDGRIRGSGIGFPPWSALVAQLPPVKGFWGGALDGFDGRL
eukprot:c22411_g1_i1 orf=788-1864(+)